MEDDEYREDALQEEPESRMDNDEISPEEEGFMKGYDDAADGEEEFDMNSDSE